jgi:sugar phosphate isomerase/epimerase
VTQTTSPHTLHGPRWTRRALLRAAGLGAAALAVPGRWARAASGDIPVALQLYSVRDACAADFDAALAQVAAMGFAGVEFAGYYGYENRPAELRRRLDALNLKVAGTHIRTAALADDVIQRTIEFHQAIGCRFLVVPMDGAFVDPEKSKVLAETFNKVAETLKPLGMACGYHNHKGEFNKDGDKTYWDLFAERTSRDVILQQDCGWTAAAGQDPVAYVRKYPGRSRTVHFKPTVLEGAVGKKAILGQDSVDWAAVYAACAAVGGTEWIVVEQETYPDGKTPMECTRASLEGLRALVK